MTTVGPISPERAERKLAREVGRDSSIDGPEIAMAGVDGVAEDIVLRLRSAASSRLRLWGLPRMDSEVVPSVVVGRVGFERDGGGPWDDDASEKTWDELEVSR